MNKLNLFKESKTNLESEQQQQQQQTTKKMFLCSSYGDVWVFPQSDDSF